MNREPLSAPTSVPSPLLEMRHIGKRFPGVVALQNVDLTLRSGEVVAIIGENGAGKSTLIKILGGIHQPDDGLIRLDGREVRFDSVQASLARGISIIHQELVLADNLDIAGNIFLGREPIRNRLLKTLDRKEMNRRTRELLTLVGLNLSPTTPMTRLSTAEQQLVEIAKALSMESRIVVMDEPTSSLTTRETELLFKVIQDLKSRGIGILYISHRLTEILRIADRIVALRDGQCVGELSRTEATEAAMIRLMIGREISEFFPFEHSTSGRPLLQVAGLRREGSDHPVSFDVHAGEVLGFAGLVGAGRTEIMRALFGIDPIVEGHIEVEGKRVEIRSVMDAIANGIGMVPEDRKLQGLILEMSVEQNISLAGLRRLSPYGIMNRSRQRRLALEQTARLRIKTYDPRQEVLNLSGGNQQKVVLAKWLALAPKILILDEPTRGIDVNAKTEIYQLMRALAKNGIGILMVSSDMEEILRVSDRIAVMHEGRIAGTLLRPDFGEEAVLTLASGREKTEIVD